MKTSTILIFGLIAILVFSSLGKSKGEPDKAQRGGGGGASGGGGETVTNPNPANPNNIIIVKGTSSKAPLNKTGFPGGMKFTPPKIILNKPVQTTSKK